MILNKTSPVMRFFKKSSSKKSKKSGGNKDSSSSSQKGSIVSNSSSVRTSATVPVPEDDDISDTSSAHQQGTTASPVVVVHESEDDHHNKAMSYGLPQDSLRYAANNQTAKASTSKTSSSSPSSKSNRNNVTTPDYGYGDAQPDNAAAIYGYGDASSSSPLDNNAHHDYASYGHGATTSSSTSKTSSSIQQRRLSYGDEEDDLAKYGYGVQTTPTDHPPAAAAASSSSYGDEEDDLAKYGYGETTPTDNIEGGHHDFASYGVQRSGFKKQSSSSEDDDRAKYGYGDEKGSSPHDDRSKYGYGDEQQSSPDDDDRAKYGYGESSPNDDDDCAKYGYGDEQQSAPDDNTDAATKYGYGDEKQSTPDNDDSAAKYGYGDANPDSENNNKYGYGDGAPSSQPQGRRTTKTPRRSSLKASGAPPRRRASLQFGKGAEIEVTVPDGSYEGKKVKRRNSITFKDTAAVRRIAPTKSLTDEPEKLWFQDGEFRQMRQKAFAIIDRVENGPVGAAASLNGKKLCTRGLERYIGPKKAEVSGRRNQAWDSVLDEQGLQRCNNEYNDEHIANVYKYTTMHTQQEANARALQDAAEIEGYLKKTRRAYRRMSM